MTQALHWDRRRPRPQTRRKARSFHVACAARAFSRYALIAGEGARAPSEAGESRKSCDLPQHSAAAEPQAQAPWLAK
jgi:hypothetical protein